MMRSLPPQRGRHLTVVIGILMLAGQVIAAIPFAYFTLFSTFQIWDDEGTIMRWDRHLLEGLSLYDQVWNIYGPVPYVFRYVLHSFAGIPLSHDVYRFTTLALWLGSTTLCSLSVYRMTRSLSVAAIAHLLVLRCLVPITNEPGHSQGYVAVVLGFVLLLGTAVNAAPRLTSAGLGTMVAAMVLTKVNAGLFISLALAMSMVAVTPATHLGFAARLGVGAAVLTLFPSIIVQAAPDAGWCTFAIAATTGLLLTYLTALSWRRQEIKGREWLWTFIGALLAAMAIIGLANVLLGSSLPALFDAVFVEASRHPQWLSTQGLPVSPFATLGGALACVAIGAARRMGTPWYGIIAAVLQAVFGLAVLSGLFGERSRFMYVVPQTWTLPFSSWALPFLWLTVLPTDDERRSTALLPRLLLASCAGTQAMYVFPYLGSQLAFGAVSIYLCGLVCLHDALRQLVEIFTARGAVLWLRRAGAAVAAVWLINAYSQLARAGHVSWTQKIPLDLPGAQLVRLPEIQVAAFRWLAYNVAASCDTFLGAPPFESMYPWSGTSPPNAMGGRWFLTFDEFQQRDMIDDFGRYQRRCVIMNHGQMAYWLGFRSQSLPAQDHSLPLLTHLTEEFAPMGSVRGLNVWQLLVEKKGPPVLPTYSAQLLSVPGKSSSLEQPARIALRLPASNRPPVTRFQIYDPVRPAVLADTVPGLNTSPLTVHLTVRGRTHQALQGPLDRATAQQVMLLTPLKALPLFVVVRLYDAGGLLVDSVPFVSS